MLSCTYLLGGNTDLQGFGKRLSSDLRALMPEHAPIVNVYPFPTGNHSWNTVMGANTVKVPPPYGIPIIFIRPGGRNKTFILFFFQRISCTCALRAVPCGCRERSIRCSAITSWPQRDQSWKGEERWNSFLTECLVHRFSFFSNF